LLVHYRMVRWALSPLLPQRPIEVPVGLKW
jgi:hypothetical protein